MVSFQEMRMADLSRAHLPIEWEGLTVYGSISIEPAPRLVRIRYTSSHPIGEVAVRVSAFDCQMELPTGKLSLITRLVHGDMGVDWSPGEENFADIMVVNRTASASLNISNEYLVEPRGNSKTREFEAWTGDSGILMHQEGYRIEFRCNSARPQDRRKFEDIVGTIDLVYD